LALASGFGCGDSGSDAAGGSGGDGAGAGGGNPTLCEADTLCLDIVEEGEIPAARFAIVWFRIEGTVANDPTVATEASFQAGSNYLEVDLGGLTEPPDIDKACERDCAEPADCPCVGALEAAIAYVMVVIDEDASGSIDPAEVADPDLVVGIANTAVVWSNTTQAVVAAPFNELFPKGLVSGIEPYRINASGAFEPAGGGNVFELKIGPDVF